ncbi:MAG TPA: DNA repair protein RadC [Vicinamibacterales bacterium]|nr:DNA repair protein RadC [Vicinamibacterales bacterium]
MRELAPHDRPREKLIRLGPQALGDNELLAIVLGSGFRRSSVLALAGAVLQAGGGLHGLVRLTVDDLCRIGGVGPARAAQVLAAVALGRRTLVRGGAARVQIAGPGDAAAYLMPQFGARAVEHFGVVLLDTKHRVLRTAVISVGTLDASLVHPREVFREAIAGSAAAILLFHNHPSGDPAPSADDEDLTTRLVMAGRLIGIDVIDHLILADTRYCSFKETGRI